MPEPLDAPLAAAWERHLTSGARPFVIPGHKGSTDLVGPVVGGDVPLFAGVLDAWGAGGVASGGGSRRRPVGG